MSGWDGIGHMSAQEKVYAGWNLRINPATVVGPVKGLIVGEMPTKNGKVDMPLFPFKGGDTPGRRLLTLSRLTMGEFLGRIRRQNLFLDHVETWDQTQARLNAIEITQALLPGMRVLLYGPRVASAFGLTDYFVPHEHGGSIAAAIPPPYQVESHVAGAIGLAVRWAADLRKR